MNQRYVSPELTHFLGASLEDDPARYRLLINVLRNGILKQPGYTDIIGAQLDQNALGGMSGIRRYSTRVDGAKQLSSNDRYRSGFVCFADIPVGDLSLHILKYQRFGVAFRKCFLVEQGATPVWYIDKNSRTNVRRDELDENAAAHSFSPERYFDRARFYDRVDAALDAEYGLSQTSDAWETSDEGERRRLIRDFLLWHVLPFLKFFDSGLPDDHTDNFYMEREWRVAGVVTFQLADVERVILPAEWRRALREDLAEYDGQITFL